MGTQPAQRVAVKRNTLQRMCAIRRELIYQISGLYKHPQQQFNKWYRMYVHVTMFVSVCTIIPRKVFVLPHTCITLWYVQVYCVLECVRICHYGDVQVYVCNNASVYTSVSQYERMHIHALCVK